MFQPAEETFEGSKNMIENGILGNPPVDAALAYHVSPGKMPIGLFMYNDKDTMMYSVDGFKITIHGKGSHGAYPHVGVDPINIGVHIHLALQELIAREVIRHILVYLQSDSLQAELQQTSFLRPLFSRERSVQTSRKQENFWSAE